MNEELKAMLERQLDIQQHMLVIVEAFAKTLEPQPPKPLTDAEIQVCALEAEDRLKRQKLQDDHTERLILQEKRHGESLALELRRAMALEAIAHFLERINDEQERQRRQ